MATTNYFEIRQRVMDIIYAGRWPLRGTATGGSTTTVVDTAVPLPGSTADHFDYYWVKIVKDAGGAGAAPQGEIRAVSEGGWANTGTFTVSSAFTAAVAASDTYEVHPPFFHPSELDNIIFRKIRNFHAPTLFPLTIDLLGEDDNDMEYTGTKTTVWTASNATLTGSTTAKVSGLRSLSVAATAAGGYATSGSLGVVGGQQMYSAANIYVTSGDTARLVTYDVTNSANIAVSGDITASGPWQDVIVQWTVPSTCVLAQTRLMSVNNTDITFWDDYQVWRAGGGFYYPPSWITREEQVLDIVAFPLGRSALATDTYASFETASHRLPWRFERTSPNWSALPVTLYVDGIGKSRPYIIARRPLTAPTADYPASSGTANTVTLASDEADALVDGCAAEALRRLSDRETGDTKAGMLRRARALEQAWVAKLEQINEIAKIASRSSVSRMSASMR